jgi:hypothetical protein
MGACALMATAMGLSLQGQKGAAKQAWQQQLAVLKQSIAANQEKLQTYEWVETTEVSLKGKVKKREQNESRYGPDGKVQKTPIGDATGTDKPPRGPLGKIVEKKIDELKDYMDRVGSLISRYVPPDPEKMQTCFQAGNANLNLASGGSASLIFQDYAKPGDKITFVFDLAAKKLQRYTVNTYLDNPQDVVTLTAEFSSLPDGTNYIAHTLLDAIGKQIQVNTTNSNYRIVGQ